MVENLLLLLFVIFCYDFLKWVLVLVIRMILIKFMCGGGGELELLLLFIFISFGFSDFMVYLWCWGENVYNVMFSFGVVGVVVFVVLFVVVVVEYLGFCGWGVFLFVVLVFVVVLGGEDEEEVSSLDSGYFKDGI